MQTRKYFLDWLRVGAFALLILFHVGMLYVTWDFNLKSPSPAPWLEGWLLTFSVWRMPLLFLISGVASSFLLAKLGPGGFALDRVRRLVPVILFGMFVVIPPQTYVELVAKGITHDSYVHFWWFSYLRADQTLVRPLGRTMPTWDHLWFLVYLLAYALLFALGRALLGGGPYRAGPAAKAPLWLLLAGPALWLAVVNVFIWAAAPLTHNLVHDWGGHLKWAGMFATGIVCAGQPDFWEALRVHRGRLGSAALALLLVQSRVNDPLWSAVSGLYSWMVICAVCGYAAAWLDRPSKALAHLNEAILPVYVLHQPILLIAAYWLFPLRLPMPLEAAALATITLGGCFAIYELAIRPVAPMRALFGLRWKGRGQSRAPTQTIAGPAL